MFLFYKYRSRSIFMYRLNIPNLKIQNVPKSEQKKAFGFWTFRLGVLNRESLCKIPQIHKTLKSEILLVPTVSNSNYSTWISIPDIFT
jgi:hypothetical protein